MSFQHLLQHCCDTNVSSGLVYLYVLYLAYFKDTGLMFLSTTLEKNTDAATGFCRKISIRIRFNLKVYRYLMYQGGTSKVIFLNFRCY